MGLRLDAEKTVLSHIIRSSVSKTIKLQKREGIIRDSYNDDRAIAPRHVIA